MKKYNYLILTLLLSVSSLYSQIDQLQFSQSLEIATKIVARSHADSVELFWTVEKPVAWLLANKEGYIIEKAKANENINDFKELNFQPINGSPFKPWTKSQYESYFNVHDEEEIGVEQVYYTGILLKVIEENDLSTNNLTEIFDDGLNSLSDGKNELDMQFGFSMLLATQEKEAAIALGVRGVDRNVKKGETYIYRLRLENNSSNYTIKDSYTEVTIGSFDTAQYETKMFSKEGDKEVLIKWEANNLFSSYNVYRAENYNGNYSKVTDIPLLNSKPANYNGQEFMGFSEDSLLNGKTYHYKVMGNSPFADEMFIGEVELTPRDLTPPEQPILNLPQNISPDEVELTWSMPTKLDKDLKGFMIGRANKINGPFVKINKDLLSPNSIQFIDSNFVKGEQNYYVVQAIDMDSNVSTSMVSLVTLIDSIPPTQPVIFSGLIDSTGIVTLTLKPNKEPDLMGYRIFRSNSKSHEYSLIYESFSDSLNSKNTIYYDTLALNTLTKSAFYKVIALDDHYNLSLASESIEIIRPDTIPPVFPLFNEYKTTQDQIQLSIIPSSSKDVSKIEIYRKEEKENSQFELIKTLLPHKTYYTDTAVTNNVTYMYKLRAIDESGNQSSFSGTLLAKTYPMNYLLPVDNPTISYDDDTQKVLLNWDYADSNEEFRYVIFKKETNKKWINVKTIQNNKKNEYSEKQTKNDLSDLIYKVKVYSDRKESVGDIEVSFN